MMDSLNIDKNLLSVSEEHFNDGKINRMRSERASSLALPHSSLLDFYDKEQEQCSSIALLPTTVGGNGIVRRHSSHYYPMLEDKQKQQKQQQQQQQQQNTQTNTTKTEVQSSNAMNQEPSKYIVPCGRVEGLGAGAGAGDVDTAALAATPPPPIPKRTFREKYTTVWPGSETDGMQTTITTTSRGKQLLQQLQQQQQQQQLQGTAFVYPQKVYNGSNISVSYFTNNAVGSQSISPSLFAIDAMSRSSYSDCLANDTDAISDDDRMSLENSVFDESLTSTPVKVTAAYNATKYAAGVAAGSVGDGGGVVATTGHVAANAYSAKTIAALNGDLSSHVAKLRSNRSSSSTFDSSTSTSTSGYASGHSERLASNSTTADFRSRFSSVDTQSSLDSNSLAADKVTQSDSPMSKVTFKLDRAAMHEAMRHLSNNNDATVVRTQPGEAEANNNLINNNDATAANSQTKPTLLPMLLPAVPVRKQTTTTTATTKTSVDGMVLVPKLLPPTNQQQQQQQQQEPMDIANTAQNGKRVSNSTSTTSTASAGSTIGTLSGSSMSSISTAAATNSTMETTPTPPPIATINTITTTTTTAVSTQKRPVPPAPPMRTHNSFDINTESNVNNTNNKPPPLTIRNKLNRNKPPPIVYPRLHQRQDSNLSSDSFSVTSSPGYNSKNIMDAAPLLQHASRINKNGSSVTRQEQDTMGLAMSRFGQPNVPTRKGINYRQDSTISSDSFSMTSSPGYNTKIMEAPLLPSLSAKRLCSMPAPIVIKQKLPKEPIEEMEPNLPRSPLTKCVSTPASLQTIVRFQNGTPNTMPLQHQIINRRKSSNPYITNGRLKFRLFQILINAFALLAIAGGLAAYFNAYPTIKFVNKTIINTVHVEDTSSFGKNPAPGTCLPIIVKFCQGAQIPYNYTVFPNYIGHFGQLETQVDLDAYEALVDVRCYELVSLFLCTLFVPKCGATGATVPPCKTLCTETMRRCGFFFDVFGLSLPEYLNCKLFKDFESAEDCVGLDQVRDVMIAAANPKCDGFQCDQNRCLPKEYVCDGHLDCMDQADEDTCERCEKDEIYCGDDRCIGEKHICDGIIDCPYGQDERNCIRLSERNGDLAKGVLEVFRYSTRQWTPACVKNWDRAVSPSAVCSMLGYNSVNATNVLTQRTHRPLLASVNVSTDIWKMYAKKQSTIMQEFSNCKPTEDYPIAELTCSNYQCGKVKRGRHKPSRRIIGGSQVNPGTWPFLAAILGGPEKVFYCAGVLISDQWVLTASHCIGNHTVIDLEDWTIQLGVTRRNSFTYTGQKVKVKTVIPHPQYNTAIAHDNDIALFQLATRVAFHEHLLPVCLPPPNIKTLVPHQMCTVIGWGKREDKDPKSTYEYIVNEVQVPIIRRQQCDEWLDNLTVSDGMICAGFEEGGRDACQGDSGGPLLCPYPGQKDRWFVGGIVSWGIMCAHPKLPGVYANVTKYVPWIHEQIQKYSKPINEERIMKYDVHPGGPDILSNMATNPIRNKKPYYHQNRSPMDIDYYENMEKI